MNWNQKEMVDPERITMEAFPLTPVLVTTLYDDGRVNIATISYVGVLSEGGKQLIGLAIRPTRFTHERIKATRNFGINVPSADLWKVVNYCGSVCGRDVFKLQELQKFKDEKCRLTLQSSNRIKTPLIAECPINLECKLLRVLELSKERASHDYFIGEVVAMHREKGFRIEDYKGLVTANYDFREVGRRLGSASKVWQKEARRKKRKNKTVNAWKYRVTKMLATHYNNALCHFTKIRS